MDKTPNYNRWIAAGLFFTLVILIGFTFYWIDEPTRVEAASKEMSEERIHKGKAIYSEQCSACHGADGEGGIGPALNNRDLLKNTQDELFFSIIRSGVPNTQMPAWSVDFGGPMTDEDVRNAVAYLRSWEDTAPVIEPVVFTPSAERGAVLFASTCAVCHGENGVGTDKAPAINDPARLASLDNSWYHDTIRNGRPAKGMPTWGTVLSPNQIDDLLALVDAWRAGTEVVAEYNIQDLLNSAIFSLENDDIESAALHIQRAISVAPEMPAEMLRNAQAQMDAGDTAGALVTLTTLRDQWPIGDPTLGAELYATKCGMCHGPTGEGGIGKQLNPNEFVQSQNNAQLVEFIQTGRPGTAMAGFSSRLTEEEIAGIVAFLRLWQPQP